MHLEVKRVVSSHNEPVSSFSSLAKEDEAFGSTPIAAKAFCLAAGILSGIILTASLKAFMTPLPGADTRLAERRDVDSIETGDGDVGRSKTYHKKTARSGAGKRNAERSRAFATSTP